MVERHHHQRVANSPRSDQTRDLRGRHEAGEQILAGIESLQKKKRDARVIVYPGVGRGFDFRPPEVRTFADDLATQDSLQRTAAFIRQHLGAR